MFLKSNLALSFYSSLWFWLRLEILSTIWGCNVNITSAATSVVSALSPSVLATSSGQEDRQQQPPGMTSDQISAVRTQFYSTETGWDVRHRSVRDLDHYKYPKYSPVHKVKPNSCLYENLSWVLLCSVIINTRRPGLFLPRILIFIHVVGRWAVGYTSIPTRLFLFRRK